MWRSERIVYDIDELGLQQIEDPEDGDIEERTCYDFVLERIPMVVTPLVGERGLNRVVVTSSERPARVSGVGGEVRAACFEGFYNGETIKSPRDGLIDVTPENLERTREGLLDRVAQITTCPYFGPEADPNAPLTPVTRGQMVGMIEECMPRKVELEGKLYRREDLVEIIDRHLDAESFPRIPARSYELFVPIQNFRPDRHCWRPWELDLLDELLADVDASCRACVEPAGDEMMPQDEAGQE